MREHSLEVQLPFLQYLEAIFVLCRYASGNINMDTWKNWDMPSQKLSRESGDVLIIASSDMTHYEDIAGIS